MSAKVSENQEPADPAYIQQTLVGHTSIEQQIRQRLSAGQLNHGWIIAGPKSIGKATLAMRIARAKLSPNALVDKVSLTTDPENDIVRKVTNIAYSDFFVARRVWDEKKGKFSNDIPVDRIRALTQSLNFTASGDHGRVAIIDSADDMNINAANALLKILEEPPERTLILLLSHAPGRLLATLRSRCRRLDLRPVPDVEIISLLRNETTCTDKEIDAITSAARGRPGYALTLAQEGGAEALLSAERFVDDAMARHSVAQIVAQFSQKDLDSRWPIFRDHVLGTLSDRARFLAAEGSRGPEVLMLLEGWEKISQLCARGERLNLDRPSLIEAMGYDLAQISRKGAL